MRSKRLTTPRLGFGVLFSPRFHSLKAIQWQKISFLLFNWDKTPSCPREVQRDVTQDQTRPGVAFTQPVGSGRCVSAGVTRTVTEWALGAGGCHPAQAGLEPTPAHCRLQHLPAAISSSGRHVVLCPSQGWSSRPFSSRVGASFACPRFLPGRLKGSESCGSPR